MPRNRIIHNLQEVFIGSPVNETDVAITGVAGKQVLQRIERIQSLEYSIDSEAYKNTVLGKTHNVIDSHYAHPDISLNLSYYSYGVNNELRMGLNTDNDSTTNIEKGKNIVENIALHEVTGRNIYLVINNDKKAMHLNEGSVYPPVLADGTGFQEEDIIDPNSANYSVVVFQNCHLNSYTSQASVNVLSTVQADFMADNIVVYSSASGINIPYLDLKKGEVTNTVASVYTSDFSAGFGGWIAADGFLHWGSWSDEPTAEGGPSLRLKGNDAESSHRIYNELLTVGKKYRITGKFYAAPGAGCGGNPSVLGGIYIYDGWGYELGSSPTINAWESFDIEFTAKSGGGAGEVNFYARNSGGGTTLSMCDTDYIYFRNIVVTEVKEFIIPKYFNKSMLCGTKFQFDDPLLLSKPADVTVDISRSAVEGGIRFQTENIQDVNISISLGREPMSFVGEKIFRDRPVTLPIEATLSLGVLTKDVPTGSLLENMNSEEEYNVVVSYKDQESLPLAVYTFSGAKFESKSNSSSVGAGETSTLDFSTSMDLINESKGLFLSGEVNSICVGVVDDNENTLTDNSENDIILGGSFFPKY